VHDLKNEAAVVDTELEDGCRVGLAAFEIGPPFDVEANEHGEWGVEAEGFEEPGVDEGRGGGKEGLDSEGGVEGDGVGVVGVVREVVVDDCDFEGWGCRVWSGGGDRISVTVSFDS